MISSKNNLNLIRSFIAIDFPEEITKEIARIHPLLINKFVGKYTELENLHLTLKFLGEISKEKIDQIKTLLSTLKFNQFQAHLEELGTFSIKGNPKILWVKIAGKSVYDLQSEIDNLLSSLFPKEERFMSHLTIARIKLIKDKTFFLKTLNDITVKKIQFPVQSFKLMSSDLHPLGPIYSLIEEYKLK